MSDWDVISETPLDPRQRPVAAPADFSGVTARVQTTETPLAAPAPAVDPWAVVADTPEPAAPQETFLESIGRRVREQLDKPLTQVISEVPGQQMGALESLGRGVASGLSNIGGTASLLSMPGGALVDTIAEAITGEGLGASDYLGGVTSRYFQDADRYVAEDPRGRDPENRIISALGTMAPDLLAALATGGESAVAQQAVRPAIQQTVRQAVGQAAERAVESGVRGSVVPAVSRGAQLGTDVIEAGGTPGEALEAAGAGAAGTALSNIIPASASGRGAVRALEGAASNPVADLVQTIGENAALPDRLGLDQGYGLDDAIVSAIVGAPLAGVLGERAPERLADPERMRQVPAADTTGETLRSAAPVDAGAASRVQTELPAIPQAQPERITRAEEQQAAPGEIRPAQPVPEEGSAEERAAAPQRGPQAVTPPSGGATPLDRLAPRTPVEPVLSPGTDRVSLVNEWRAATTDAERANAAAKIAAFDRQQPAAETVARELETDAESRVPAETDPVVQEFQATQARGANPPIERAAGGVQWQDNANTSRAVDMIQRADIAPEAKARAIMRAIEVQADARPEQRELAARLAPLMEPLGIRFADVPANAPAHWGGGYNLATNEFWTRQRDPSTLLHEALHGVTSNLLTYQGGDSVPKLRDYRREMLDLGVHVNEYAKANPGSVPDDLRALFDAPQGPLGNIKELLSYGMTDRRVQDWLRQVPVPRSRSAARNVWEAFKAAIAKLFGKLTPAQRSTLDALIETTGDLVQFAGENPDVYATARDRVREDVERRRRPAMEPASGTRSIDAQLPDGTPVKVTITPSNESRNAMMEVYDAQGRGIGHLWYGTREAEAGQPRMGPRVMVDESMRRRGVATLMYRLAEENGGKLPPLDARNADRSEDGQAFREGLARKGLDPSQDVEADPNLLDQRRTEARAARASLTDVRQRLRKAQGGLDELRQLRADADRLIGEIDTEGDYTDAIREAKSNLRDAERDGTRTDVREGVRALDRLERAQRDLRAKVAEANRTLDKLDRREGKASEADREAAIAALTQAEGAAARAAKEARRLRDWRAGRETAVREAYAERNELFGELAAEGYAMGSPTQQPQTGRFEPLRQAADTVRIQLQDKMLPLLRAQQRAGGKDEKAVTSVNLDDVMNAYRMENLMHGRAKDQADRANTDLILPAQRQMKNLGVTPEMLQDVMLATHAAERNARVAAMPGAMADGAAGITTAEAAEVLAGTREGPYSGKKLSAGQVANARKVWEKFRKIREITLDNMVAAGQITQEQADQARAAYKDYVPLRGKEDDFAGDLRGSGTGQGLSVAKGNFRRALGRGAGNLPQNILGEIVGDLQRSIVAKEKSRVAEGFLRFALANPMPDLFTVEPVDLEWKYSEATGEAYLAPRNSAEDAERSMIVRRDGQPVRIRFEDPQLRDAMLNMGPDDLGALVRTVGAVNRWRSAVLTRFNPAFTPINVMRDLQFGIAALAAERGTGAAARAAFDYLPALRAMYRDAGTNRRGDASKPDAQKNWDDWAREAGEAGMKTGLTQAENAIDLQRQLTAASMSLMQYAAEGRPFGLARESIKRPIQTIAGAIERVNDATENALRLAAYVADRKRGRSRDQAAEYAKNLTINFNRKGRIGPALNALYLFYNASIQGTHAVQRVLRSPKVLTYLAGLAGLQAMFADQLMEDEELDGVTVWDEIPDYVKRTSLVIPLGAMTGNKRDYFALPMPFGFNVFPYTGGRAMQRYRLGHRQTDSSMVSDVLKAQIEAFSPVPVADGYGAMFGDQLGFAMQLAANRDDLGRPIAAESPYEDYESPAALKGQATTPRVYQAASQIMAALGGGDLEKRIPPVGYLDVAPEQIEAVVNYFGGGLASLGNKGFRWWEQLDAGNTQGAMDVIAQTPIASRLFGRANTARALADRYYGERGELARARDVLNDRIAEGMDPEQALRQAKEENPQLRGLEPDRYKRDTKDKKVGDVKRTSSGNVQLKAEAGSVTDAMKSAERKVKAANKAIRTLRGDVTNAEVVKLLEGYEFKASDAGLPEGFTADVDAPARVRNRAIRLIQDKRQEAQAGFLKVLKLERSSAEAEAKLRELEDDDGES